MKTKTPEKPARKYHTSDRSSLYSYSGYYYYSKQPTLNTGYNYNYLKDVPDKLFFKRYLL